VDFKGEREVIGMTVFFHERVVSTHVKKRKALGPGARLLGGVMKGGFLEARHPGGEKKDGTVSWRIRQKRRKKTEANRC